MIILTRTNAIYSSPRIEKCIDFVEKTGLEYRVIGWDRKDSNISRPNTLYFRKKSGHNVGGFKAVLNRLEWFWFLFKMLYKFRKEVSVIHAFDLDTAFPSCVFKLLCKANVKVIFDVCDWFSATLHDQNRFILYIFKALEKFTIKHSDEVIICEAERIEQIPFRLNKSALILPNIPYFEDRSFLKYDDSYKFASSKISVAYVGGFSESRCLEELLQLADQGEINLLIAGFGSSSIENRCEELSNRDNVRYFGKVDYKKGLNIMYNSDVIYAMYSKSNPNHFYAAPNKYYEAMMLGKPIISTAGISLGRKIIDNDIGYVVEESVSDLNQLFDSITSEDLLRKGNNAMDLWHKQFSTYTKDFLTNKYFNILNFSKD